MNVNNTHIYSGLVEHHFTTRRVTIMKGNVAQRHLIIQEKGPKNDVRPGQQTANLTRATVSISKHLPLSWIRDQKPGDYPTKLDQPQFHIHDGILPSICKR